MRKLILLIVLAAAGYFAYSRFQSGNPQHIEKPVYAELRVDTQLGSRELNLALFGEMVDDVDCHERFDRAWHKIIEGCPGCSMRLSSCRVELELHYGFNSVTLQTLVGPVFDKVASTLVDAFVKRAEQVYAAVP